MSGRLIDLAVPNVRLPRVVVLDTNVVVARLLGSEPIPRTRDEQRAFAFFHNLLVTDRQAILTPTAYSETLHVSIRLAYERELRLNRQNLTARYGVRITSWIELYKRDPSLLDQYVTDMDLLRQRLVAGNVLVAGPEDLGAIASGRRYQDELVHLVGRYRLDTSDALILMEASRLGINAVVTLDQDLQRALRDFDIYTWL